MTIDGGWSLIAVSTSGKTAPGNRGRGEAIAWLRANLDYNSDGCLIWPFSRTKGYGVLGYNGKHYYAHRYMCELAHGPAPTAGHQTAHSCGRGHDGCVNPKHLAWKTPSENMRDKEVHGTTKPRGLPFRRLTQEQVDAIRTSLDETIAVVADRFSISESHVRKIRSGENWRPDKRYDKRLTDDEVRAIRAMRGEKPARELAQQFGVSSPTISRIQSGVTYVYVPVTATHDNEKSP